MRRPFVWFLTSLIIGITAGRYSFGLVALAAVASAGLFASLKNRIAEPMFMPLITVIGILLCTGAFTPSDKNTEALAGEDVTVVGTVRSFYITVSGKAAITLDADLITDGVTENEKRLKIFVTADKADIAAGDVIEADGRLYSFELPENPYQMDYRTYMMSKGYDYSFYSTQLRNTGRRENEFIYKIERARENVNRFFDGIMPEREAGMAKALSTGYKYDVTDDTEELFRNLGISHVLAVSGLHVSVIAGFLFFLLTYVCKIRKRAAIPFVCALLILYLAFTGFSPSACRAVVMSVTALAAFMLYKNSDRFNTIAFSAFIMLCINPLYLWNVSFQLSYAGITAVAVAVDMVGEAKYTGKLSKTAMFSIVVWIITTPLVMYYFGGVSLIAPITNILIVPYLSMVTGMAMIAAMLSATSLGAAAGNMVYTLLNLYNSVADRISDSRLYMNTARPSLLALAVIYVFIFACVAFRKRKTAVKITAGLFSAAAAVWIAVQMNAPAEIVFFSAGQGDASAVYVPGEILAVIDGGPKGGAEKSVIPYVEAKSKKADLLFITHMDADHSTGALELIERNMVRQVVISDAEHSEKINQVLCSAEKNNIPVFYAAEGDTFLSGDVIIECLYPYYGMEHEENSTSLVLKIKYGDTSVLFTGDIEEQDEEYLLDSDIDCDIIKIAHHGSKTSSTYEFLNKTGADIAVIEADDNNIYGFPHKEVVDRLNELGMDIYVTGQDGAVTVYDNGENFRIKKQNGEY